MGFNPHTTPPQLSLEWKRIFGIQAKHPGERWKSTFPFLWQHLSSPNRKKKGGLHKLPQKLHSSRHSFHSNLIVIGVCWAIYNLIIPRNVGGLVWRGLVTPTYLVTLLLAFVENKVTTSLNVFFHLELTDGLTENLLTPDVCRPCSTTRR